MGCPPLIRIEQLFAGSVHEPESTELREHLDSCDGCLSILDKLSEDHELTRWKSGNAPDYSGLHTEKSLRELMQQLREMPETVECLDEETNGPGSVPLDPPGGNGFIGSLDGFQIRSELGRGGMGIVFLAEDPGLKRLVALKMLRPDRVNEVGRARFVREAQAAAKVRNDNIVAVHSVAAPVDRPPFLVMEYVAGPSLRDRIANDGPLSPREAATICLQIANGLSAAHASGLTHRDVKPGNIMLDQQTSRAKIMDFGLARLDSQDHSLTREGLLAGTPAYMSPEQVTEAGQVDPQTDVYSLGITLYEMLTGEPPFAGTPQMILRQIVEQEPRPPRLLNENVPADLQTICLKAIAKEPGRRYATALKLRDDLRRWRAGEPILARPIGWAGRGWRWCRRNPRVAALTAVVAALTVALAIGSTVASVQLGRAYYDVAQSRELVKQSAELAREQRSLALKTLRGLVTRVQNQIGRNPGALEEGQQVIQEALDGLDQITQSMGRSSDSDIATIQAHQQIGDIYRLGGKAESAREHYDKSRAMAEALLDGDPNQTQAMSGLAGALDRLGTLAKQGYDYQKAEELYRSAIYWTHRAAALDAADISIRRQEYQSHRHVGDVRFLLGDFAQARENYEKAIDIAVPLFEKYPEDRALREDFLTCRQSAGWACTSLIDRAAAQEHLAHAARIAESLKAEFPGYYHHQRSAALVIRDIGQVHLYSGEFETARERFQESFEALQQLAAPAPDNSEMQWDVALVHDRLALACRALGDWAGAEGHWESSAARISRWAGDPNSAAKYTGDMVNSLSRLMYLAVRIEDSTRAQQRCQAILELYKQRPPDTPYHSVVNDRCEILVQVFPLMDRAVEDPSFIEKQPGELHEPLYRLRGRVLAQRGRHAEADVALQRAAELTPKEGFVALRGQWEDACCYSLCAKALLGDRPNDSLTNREQMLVDRYLEESANRVRKMVDASLEYANFLRTEPDLEFLFSHEKYRNLLEDRE